MTESKAERFEAFLFDKELLGQEFNHAAVVEHFEVTGYEATRMIQAYLAYQDRPDSDSLFVLRRIQGTRTANAMWHVGARALDARGLGSAFADDLRTRLHRVIGPSLARIDQKNPHAHRAVEAVTQAMEVSINLLVGMLDDGQVGE